MFYHYNENNKKMNIDELEPISQSWNIVFRGGIDPNFNAVEVKNSFAHLHGLSEERKAHFFSGREVIVKKGLSQTAAEQYKHSLERIGLVVYLVIDEETLVVKSKMAEEREFGSSLDIKKERARTQVDTTIDTLLKEKRHVAPPIFSCSIEGRFSNTNFLAVCACLIPVFVFVTLILLLEFGSFKEVPKDVLQIMSSASILGLVFLTVGLIALVCTPIFFVRAVILRLHDLGLSGWWSGVFVALLVAIVLGMSWLWHVILVLAVILFCIPGRNNINIHGLPPVGNGLFGTICSVLVLVFSLLFMQSSDLQHKTISEIKKVQQNMKIEKKSEDESQKKNKKLEIDTF